MVTGMGWNSLNGDFCVERIHSDCAEKFGRMDERIEDIEHSMKRYNGAIFEINRKYDKVIWMLLTTMASSIAALVVLLLKAVVDI
jgi:hypothetical protein